MYVNNSGDLKYENFVCCVNGELVDPESGSISALDHSIIVGDGDFETVQVVDGVPFALSRHLRRLWFRPPRSVRCPRHPASWAAAHRGAPESTLAACS